MKFPSSFKHIIRLASAIFRGRFSPATTLVWGICTIAILLVLILGWDTYLFMQSISPPQANDIVESKTTLTAQDIDNAIQILDQQKVQFDTLLNQIMGTTTISF